MELSELLKSIAMLCAINGSPDVVMVEKSQADCQSFYAKCVTTYATSKVQDLTMYRCMRDRSIQIDMDLIAKQAAKSKKF